MQDGFYNGQRSEKLNCQFGGGGGWHSAAVSHGSATAQPELHFPKQTLVLVSNLERQEEVTTRSNSFCSVDWQRLHRSPKDALATPANQIRPRRVQKMRHMTLKSKTQREQKRTTAARLQTKRAHSGCWVKSTRGVGMRLRVQCIR